MKHIKTYLTSALAILALSACQDGKKQQQAPDTDTTATTPVAVPDSAIYGVIGEGTTMHTLELLVEENTKSLSLSLDADTTADVQGGLFAGDRVSVIPTTTADGTRCVSRLVNMTTLMGKWVSLDRNFEIKPDGEIATTASIETNPYTHWAMRNGSLILGTDTFTVLALESDSMLLESTKGVFAYKRMK